MWGIRMSDYVIPPPNNLTAYDERKPVLYRADGTALVRSAGFMPVQTRGTTPAFMAPRPPKKGGKKSGGKKC